MSIRVRCETHNGSAESMLHLSRDEQGGWVVRPEPGWRIVERRRTTGDGQDVTDVHLVCSEACEIKLYGNLTAPRG